MKNPHSTIAGQTSKSADSSAVHHVNPHRINIAAANAMAIHGHNQIHLCMTSYSFMRLSRSAFRITETELKLIAAAAMIGESSKPKKGYSTPAATGIPSTL